MPTGVYPRTPEMNAKMSVTKKGIQFSEQHRQRLSLAACNRPPMGEEQKQKIRQANSGKGAQRTGSYGYVFIYYPDHPRANKEDNLSI